MVHFLCDMPFTVICSNRVCSQLSVPLAPEGPSTSIFLLGIVIDSMAMKVLPQEKLLRIKADIGQWVLRKRCTNREIQSLTGLLNNAASVVPSGCTFLRSLYNLLSTVMSPRHHIYINSSACADLALWSLFIDTWNGVSVLHCRQPLDYAHAEMFVFLRGLLLILCYGLLFAWQTEHTSRSFILQPFISPFVEIEPNVANSEQSSSGFTNSSVQPNRVDFPVLGSVVQR